MIGLSILLVAIVYVWVVRTITRHISNRSIKYLIISIFILIPTWDAVTGRLYFETLCKNEGGIKVYQTVEISKEYWDVNGNPMFLKANGDLDKAALGNRFLEHSLTEAYPSIFKIDMRHEKVVDGNTHEILGEVISFMYWGGWVDRYFSPHNSAIHCKKFYTSRFLRGFYLSLFKPTNT